MLDIFEEERRGLASSEANPDRIFPAANFVATTSQASYVGPATWRHLLLTAGKIRCRHDNILILNRP